MMAPAHLGAIGWNTPASLVVVKVTVVLLAAAGITLIMQRASAGARHLVWLLTLATLLVMPSLNAWSPLHLRVLPASAVQAAAVSPPSADYAAQPANAVDRLDASNVASNPVREPSVSQRAVPGVMRPSIIDRLRQTSIYSRVRGLGAIDTLLIVWLAVAAVIAGWLGFAALAVRRIVRASEPLSSREWVASLWEVSDRLGLANAPRLVKSDMVKMPFACGVLNPTVVFPAECEGWSADRRNAVLLHELAHVRRHDLAGHTLGRIACAVYWFHPLVWSAAKRLRSESERACDDLAITCGARASDYAEHLLDIVTSVRGDRTPSVALAMARRKEFEGRMLAILDPDLRHSTPGRMQSVMLVGSLALVAVVVGAAAPARRELPARPALAAQTVRAEPSADPADVSTTAETRTQQMQELQQVQRQQRQMTQVATAQSSAYAYAESQATSVARASSSVLSESSPVPKSAPAPLAAPPANVIAQQLTSGKGERTGDRETLLIRVLGTDTSANLRRIAAWGLSEYSANESAARALANALGHDSDSQVREMSAWAFAQSNSPGSIAVPALSAAVRGDADVSVRRTSLWALGSVGDRNAEPVLSVALSDNDAEVRQMAAWGMGMIGIRTAPPALVAKLNDGDPRVRRLVAWALYSIQDASTIPALKAALRQEKSKEQQVAEIRVLASMGDQSVDVLQEMLSSPDVEVKTMAVKALASGRTAPWPWPWPRPRPFP